MTLDQRHSLVLPFAITATILFSSLFLAGTMGAALTGSKILASDGTAGDRFGDAVSIHGVDMAVGAWRDDDFGRQAGSVYMFQRDANDAWIETQKLEPPPTGLGAARLGQDVALHGNWLLASQDGGPGMVQAFERDGTGTWQLRQTLTGSNPVAGMAFGYSIAIDGDSAVIGARAALHCSTCPGRAYVFDRDASGTWNEVQMVTASDGHIGDAFGSDVDIADDRMIVAAGDHEYNGMTTGSAYVFEKDANGAWNEVAKLLSSEIDGGDRFGASVAIEGDWAFAGADGDDGPGGFTGAMYVFQRDPAGTWNEVQKITELPSDASPNINFGAASAVHDGILAVGAPNDDQGAGIVYTYAPDAAGTWASIGSLILSGPEKDRLGTSVAIDSDYMVAGAITDRTNGLLAGAVYVAPLNSPPVAVIAPAPVAECFQGAGDVLLDGTGSYDPDGDPITFLWSGSGVTFDDPASPTPTGTFPYGTSVVTLTVTDVHGMTDSATQPVEVADTIPPTVVIGRPAAGQFYNNDMESGPATGVGSAMALGKLTVRADVTDQCGVLLVAFESTTVQAASDRSAPYTFESNPPPGLLPETSTVTATATDFGRHHAAVSVTFQQKGQ